MPYMCARGKVYLVGGQAGLYGSIYAYLVLDELLVLDVELVVERDAGLWAVDLVRIPK